MLDKELKHIQLSEEYEKLLVKTFMESSLIPLFITTSDANRYEVSHLIGDKWVRGVNHRNNHMSRSLPFLQPGKVWKSDALALGVSLEPHGQQEGNIKYTSHKEKEDKSGSVKSGKAHKIKSEKKKYSKKDKTSKKEKNHKYKHKHTSEKATTSDSASKLTVPPVKEIKNLHVIVDPKMGSNPDDLDGNIGSPINLKPPSPRSTILSALNEIRPSIITTVTEETIELKIIPGSTRNVSTTLYSLLANFKKIEYLSKFLDITVNDEALTIKSSNKLKLDEMKKLLSQVIPNNEQSDHATAQFTKG